MITALPRVALAVADYGAAVATFRDVFGMPVLDFSDRTVPDLGAHVGMCMPRGGSNVELMAPGNPDLPLSQAIQRTLDRRGEGFYALMLEAPVPDDEAVELAARGLDVLPLMAGAGGRDVHPRSTSGVLVRVYPNDSVVDPGGLTSTEPGLTGILRTVVATDDLDAAARAYGTGFGLRLSDPVVDEHRGLRTVVATPPKGGVIELAAVVDATRPAAAAVAATLAGRGPGLHAIVLGATDPAAATALLRNRGVSAHDDGTGDLDVFGARVVIDAFTP